MSGFEVVGVVLGAAPLVISALEAYQGLGKKRDAFKRKSLHIDRMVRALRWQQKLIYSDVRLVMRNAGLDEATINQHLGVGHYEVLRRQDVQDAVDSFLGDNCSTYLEVVQQCEGTLLDVAKAIKGFDQDSTKNFDGSLAALVQAKQDVDKSAPEFWKRVKFSMHKEDLERSIKEIDEFSRILERIREKSQQEHQVVVQTNSASARAATSMLQKVHTRALRLHQALEQGWRQPCQDQHEARLYLESRIDKANTMKCKQKINFSLTLQGCTDPPYHTCVVEDSPSIDAVNHPNIKISKVTFTPPAPIPTTSNPRSDVDDICRLLNDCLTKQHSLKLYLAENEKLCYEAMSSNAPSHQLSHVHEKQTVSLADLLEDRKYKRTMQLKPRVKLAALIASSVLQLHATPWYRALRKESLLFVPGSNGEIDLSAPFVSCDFCQVQSQPTPTPTPVHNPSDQDLLDLGILILELWHKEDIGAFAFDMGLALENNFDSRQSVARKWIVETKDDMLTSIYEAATRCINCRFDAVDIDLLDPKLRISMFEGVVRPLWENCGS